MPKSQFINPNDIRKPGKLTFGTIPLNQYDKSVADERKNFTDGDFVRISRIVTHAGRNRAGQHVAMPVLMLQAFPGQRRAARRAAHQEPPPA